MKVYTGILFFKIRLPTQLYSDEDWEVVMAPIIYSHRRREYAIAKTSSPTNFLNRALFPGPSVYEDVFRKRSTDLVNGTLTGLQNEFKGIYLKSIWRQVGL